MNDTIINKNGWKSFKNNKTFSTRNLSFNSYNLCASKLN